LEGAGHHVADERGIREFDQLYDFSVLKSQQVEAIGRTCRVRRIVSDDQAGVHGSAVSLHQFAQDPALYKLEIGNEPTKGLPQGTLAVNASGCVDRLPISNQREHGFGMEGHHETIQVAFAARCVSPPDQFKHGFAFFHLRLLKQQCRVAYLRLSRISVLGQVRVFEPLDHDRLSFFEHDPFGKPVSTFPYRALSLMRLARTATAESNAVGNMNSTGCLRLRMAKVAVWRLSWLHWDFSAHGPDPRTLRRCWPPYAAYGSSAKY
jgi:hypothetical protein